MVAVTDSSITETKSVVRRCNISDNGSTLRGGMLSKNSSCKSAWDSLNDRFARLSLVAYDVGGNGDCFFKSVSHQLYKTADLHFKIRKVGIQRLNNHPEHFIESISDNNWQSYIQQMSTSSTWCENIIIQAVSNAFNCIIHITEYDINKPDGTVITPVLCQEQRKTIFIGYINELHYVSLVSDKTGKNKSKLTYLKSKLLETDDQKETRLAKRRNAYETDDQKETRLANRRKAYETDDQKQTRLAKRRKAYEKMKSLETDEERQKRLAKQKDNINQKRARENAHGTMRTAGITNQELKTKSKETQNVTTQNLTESGKKSQGLTEIEEKLIACALPIMRVYIKPGGQRGYSGHCINLPQHVQELATSLPRCPKELSLTVIKMKGKDNTFKDVSVRGHRVQNALTCLINNNPHYQDVHLNQQCLQSLPKNGIPNDLISIERENDVSESSDLNFGPRNEEEIVYNEGTQVNTFLPIPQCQQQEIDAIQQKLSSIDNQHIAWPTVDNEPMNEYLTPFLATMAFPTLFPDGKGDPTNPSLNRDVQFDERIKHLLKYAEKENGTWLYRFASHPSFAYWALNMIPRKRIL